MNKEKTEKQTWYSIDRYYFSKPYPDIKPITVLKETEYTVTVEESWMNGPAKPVRRNKDNNLFRTKMEAEAEVTRRLTEDVRKAERELSQAKAAFDKWFVRA